MHIPSRISARRSSRRGGASRFPALTLATAVLGLLALSVLVSGPAVAETSTPDPSSTESVAATISITSPTQNAFISGTRTDVTGTKGAGSSVTIPSLTGGEPLCVVDASGSTSWECTDIVLPSGTVGLVAREYVDGNFASESDALTLRVLGSPAFTTAGPFVNAGSLDGLGWDGASIRIVFSSPVSAVQSCAQQVGDGYWYCGIDPARFPSGTYRVQVEQSWPGSSTEWSPASAASTLVIDREIPAAPVVTSPTNGTRLDTGIIQFTGTGEADAYVDVYVDDTSVCNTRVVGTSWSCVGSAVGSGSHTIRVVQQDVAGNVSSPSATVSVIVAAAPTATTAPPAAGAPTPRPSASVPATPAPSTAPVPAPESAAPSPSATAAPPTGGTEGADGTDGGGADPAPPLSWGTPTGYGAAITAPAETLAGSLWVLAAGLALGWLLLIAVPLRLLATTLRGRLSLHGPHLTGRNRLSTERRQVEEALPTVSTSPVFVAGGALVGAALLAVLASGIQGEVRYIRLTVAVAVGLAVLNAVAALAIRWCGRARGLAGDIHLVPLFLAVGAATAILSRAVDIQPPLVMGIVVGATFAMGVSARDRGRVQLVQVGAITVLAVLAWLALGAAGSVEGFWMSALSEMLSAVCLGGFGSALVLLLPVLRLPGRAIFEWSPVLWGAATVGVATLGGAVFVGENFPIGAVAVGAAVVAVVCLCVWGWARFVQQPAH